MFEQMEDDRSDHRGRHGKRSRAREHAEAQQARTHDLGGSSRERPELRRARQEAKELGDNVGGEAVDVLDLVEAVVHHERAGAKAHRRDAQIRDGLDERRCLLLEIRDGGHGEARAAGDDGLRGRERRGTSEERGGRGSKSEESGGAKDGHFPGRSGVGKVP